MDSIQNVMTPEIGIDFIGTPTSGRNRLVVKYAPIVNAGAVYQNVFSSAKVIQDAIKES